MSKGGPKPDDADAGRFAEYASSLVGALLYLARTSRPQIAFVIGFLGRYVSCWTRLQDRILLRVIEYLNTSIDDTLVSTGCMGDLFLGSLVLFVDAAFADCDDTKKSTMGFCIFSEVLTGRGSFLSGALVDFVLFHGARRTQRLAVLLRRFVPAV